MVNPSVNIPTLLLANILSYTKFLGRITTKKEVFPTRRRHELAEKQTDKKATFFLVHHVRPKLNSFRRRGRRAGLIFAKHIKFSIPAESKFDSHLPLEKRAKNGLLCLRSSARSRAPFSFCSCQNDIDREKVFAFWEKRVLISSSDVAVATRRRRLLPTSIMKSKLINPFCVPNSCL